MSAEEIRQRRKKLAALRRQRILAGAGEDGDDKKSNTRLAYVQNLASKEALKKAEQERTNAARTQQSQTASSTTSSSSSPKYVNDSNDENANIRDALNEFANNQHPFSSHAQQNGFPPPMGAHSRMDDFYRSWSAGLNGMPSINPDSEINAMMDQMLGGILGGGINGAPRQTQSTEQILAKWKDEEQMKRYDGYLHNAFCVLFVLLLVFLPYDYDVTVFGHNLSSDSWTFFISFEIVLFSVFYGYKQYLQKKHNVDTASQTGNDGMSGGGQLMTMFGAGIGASLLGGGSQMSQMIQTWISRISMIWNYIKMLRQIMSDLCLVLFLWITIICVKRLVLPD